MTLNYITLITLIRLNTKNDDRKTKGSKRMEKKISEGLSIFFCLQCFIFSIRCGALLHKEQINTNNHSLVCF